MSAYGNAKTIQIFLPDGNPRSIRIADITSRTVRAIEVPRAGLAAASRLDEVQQVGLYFLFSDGEDVAKPRVYIGQSGNCAERLTRHDARTDFWDRAVVITSKTRQFDKAQALWLEWYAIREAIRIDRYRPLNKVGPSEPHMRVPVKADLHDSFATARILLSTLGYPLFDEVRKTESRDENPDTPVPLAIYPPPPTAPSGRFQCEGRGGQGNAEYVGDGLLVLKGSRVAPEVSNGAHPSVHNWRSRLIRDGVLIDEGGRLVFGEDYLFSSPSPAAGVVIGRNANGWVAWTDENDRTLDEVIRQG